MSTGTPALREARRFDVPALADLDAELFPHDAWPETTWWAELAARPVVAEVNLPVEHDHPADACAEHQPGHGAASSSGA